MYFKNLLEGLSFLHHNGVFHRDIKPENVLLTADLQLKIADFGFSKHIAYTHMGIARTRLGTEPYMSP
jgi:serine/threonine protein kinase